MSDTTPQIGDTQPAPSVGLREAREALERERARRETFQSEADALRPEIGPLRRQAALWRAGIKPGAAAELFVERLPTDVALDDVVAVRRACAEITAAVLDGNRQLAEATP
jgi:hypothetical protein